MKQIAYWVQSVLFPGIESVARIAWHRFWLLPTRMRWTVSVVTFFLLFFVVGQLVIPTQEQQALSAVKTAVADCVGASSSIQFSDIRSMKLNLHELEFMGRVDYADAEIVPQKSIA